MGDATGGGGMRFSRAQDEGGAGPNARTVTILLADDDDALRGSFRLWLTSDRPWEVREASNGSETLEKLDETVDVLVLDRRMPEISGPEVVERLDETSFDGKVVVCSAYEQDGDMDGEAVACYATKPIQREEFIDQLEEAL